MWEPPYIIAPHGEMLITNMESLVGTSPDYSLYWFYTTFFKNIENVYVNVPFSGSISLLFISIYFLSPIIAVLVMALILKPGMLRKLLLR